MTGAPSNLPTHTLRVRNLLLEGLFMEAEARICYYLGANAPTGFYSLYDQMLDPEKARDIRILKGGPGCGKSTLMKQVGRAME